jgi:hypothetical protein
MSLLDLPVVLRTRRNHGLEHATIHILSSRVHSRPLAGRSNSRGFYILGNAPTEEVEAAVAEALQRMRNGETHMAIHPGCGTNYLTAGVFAGLAAAAAVSMPWRSRVDKWSGAVMAATFALIFSAPVGPLLQQHVTTLGEMGDLEVRSVRKLPGRVNMHFVETWSSA